LVASISFPSHFLPTLTNSSQVTPLLHDPLPIAAANQQSFCTTGLLVVCNATLGDVSAPEPALADNQPLGTAKPVRRKECWNLGMWKIKLNGME
jgi:hypothetical protein